jgi:hypothetical protein
VAAQQSVVSPAKSVKSAGDLARDVTMIGVDPAAPSTVSGVSNAVNFIGEYRGTIAGAQNIPVPGYNDVWFRG